MTEHAVPEEDRIRPDPATGHLWFGLLGAPIAWAVHFVICYGLIGVACVAGWSQFVLLGLNSVTALVALSTLLTLPAIIAAGLVARRALLQAREQDGAVAERDVYMGRAGLMISGFFLLVVAFEGLIVFVWPPCG
jgi:hypothetical protein